MYQEPRPGAPEGTKLPESITVILKRNDEPVARKKVTAADDWSYEFTFQHTAKMDQQLTHIQ